MATPLFRVMKCTSLGFLVLEDLQSGIWGYGIEIYHHKQWCGPVANRETPISDSSGVFRVVTNGSLLVIVGINNTTVWSSDTSMVSPTTIYPVAQLLNSGNLVVRVKGEESFIWQSFDYPGDTLLSGMKLGKDLVSGKDRKYRAWKSQDDPSPGEFVTFMNTNGFPQLFENQGSVPFMRYGPWNGVTFNGFPKHLLNTILTHEFVFNDKEVYYMYTIVNRSFISHAYTNPEGNFLRVNWVDRLEQWSPYWNSNTDRCVRFGLCGPNGMCNPENSPYRTCMEGFEPHKPDEWSASKWSSGCRRKTPLDCPKGDGFAVFKNIKLPDTQRAVYNRSMTLDECAVACKSNCTCTAYANIKITRGGRGCLLWFGDLMDVRTVEKSQDLYVRMALSNLRDKNESSSNKKRRTIIVAVTMSSMFVMMILSFTIVYAIAWRKKTRYLVKGPDELAGEKFDEEYSSLESLQQDDDHTELSYFSLPNISKSTKYFSEEMKLGEGGFGPVYMGVLDDGREIAVKRLSKTSKQGVKEFKNELTFIAKLQHRNLVIKAFRILHRRR